MIVWHRLGDRLPEVAQHILLASKRDGEDFWCVRDAVLLIRHEEVQPSISDFEREGTPRYWWFDAIYGYPAKSDIRLPRPDYLWTPMPTPVEPSTATANIARDGRLERLTQMKARVDRMTERPGEIYMTRELRREAEALEWAIKELSKA